MNHPPIGRRVSATWTTGLIALALLLPATTAFAGLFRPPGEGTIAAKMYEHCLKEAKNPWQKLSCHLRY